MVGEPVEQGRGHFGVAKYIRPFAEGEIGGDDDRSALVEAADEVEEQLAAGLGEWQVAEFVENDEVLAGEIVGEPALPTIAALGLEPVYEIDDIVEAAARSGSNAASRDGDRQMGFARAGSADQDDIALLGDEGAAGEIAHQALVDWRVLEREVVDVLGELRIPGIVISRSRRW